MVNLSPEIVPTKYGREGDGSLDKDSVERYTYDKLMVPNAHKNPRAIVMPDGVVRYLGDPFDVYLHSSHCHVSESVYRNHGMVMLREYVLDCLVALSDDGIVAGLRKTDDKSFR